MNNNITASVRKNYIKVGIKTLWDIYFNSLTEITRKLEGNEAFQNMTNNRKRIKVNKTEEVVGI